MVPKQNPTSFEMGYVLNKTLAMTCIGAHRWRQNKTPPLSRWGMFDDLLLHGLGHTTIGAVAFHFRVRDGNGWYHNAMFTRERVEGRIKPVFWFKRTRSHGVAWCGLYSNPPSANKFLGCNVLFEVSTRCFARVKRCYRLEL